MSILEAYDPGGFWDEAFAGLDDVRPGYADVLARLAKLDVAELQRVADARDESFRSLGVTFTLGAESDEERPWPLDLVPRVLTAAEWRHLQPGLEQRIRALNAFVADCYADREALRDGVVPWDLLLSAKGLRTQACGVEPPLGVWVHVAGIDLVRGGDGRFYVLEDNLRVPSGVSYVLENRRALARVLPGLFEGQAILPVSGYPNLLLQTLQACAPVRSSGEPTVVVLTPGPANSAYFEHVFLARQTGVQLVEGRDLVVRDAEVFLRTTAGFQRVDVIYRRIDDDFLDPLSFRADSVLGVAGLMTAVRAGTVTVCNAIGTGVADDKAIYAYVPDLIRYYGFGEPILPNVQTFLCADPEQREHVLANLPDLVVKVVGEAGGYGMLIGPAAADADIATMAAKIEANPRNYIAQPVVALSRHPTFDGERFAPRHVDLRPFVLLSDRVRIVPGGLTRVALRDGSLVVNSSQGGGSKDTWVLAEDEPAEKAV